MREKFSQTVKTFLNLFARMSREVVAMVAILIFSCFGVLLLVNTQAATPTVAIETESGSVASPATKVADTGASGVSAVKFSAAQAVSFNPGNPNGTSVVPAGSGLEDVSSPTTVIGDGTPTNCTSAVVLAAVTTGGVVTFNCGADPITITLTATAKVRNSTTKLVLDGGGKVTLSGGGANRILYTNTCDTSLGSVSGNCLYAPTKPQITVQNITLADGNSTNSTNGPWSDTGGGAISQLGGRLKVVSSAFLRNTCTTNGPDLGGGAIRVYAQSSPTPNDLDSSSAARNQYPVMIVQSTFGGAAGQGSTCSNGGALSTLRTPMIVLNSLISYNNAIGCCANPAWDGTPGGGSGGAIYSDGDTYDLRVESTIITNNTAKAGGSAFFYVSNDQTGTLGIVNSTSQNNTYAPNGLSGNPHFETYPGIFYRGLGNPNFTGSTIK